MHAGGQSRIAYLDGWRGLAVLAVIFSHFVTMNYLNLGRLGVELFFVLSGRLMAEILFVRQSEIWHFLQRRFARIYPALIVFLLCAIPLSKLIGQDDITVPRFVAAATLTANYANLALGRSEVIDHVWSLCVEEHCYLALALIAVLHRRFRVSVLPVILVVIALMMASGTAQTLTGMDYASVYWRSDVRGAAVFAGAAAYLLTYQRTKPLPTWLAPLAALVGVALFANAVPDYIKHTTGTLALAAALVGLSSTIGSVQQGLSIAPLALVGTLSYSLYLWQQLFYKSADTLKGHLLLLPVVFVVGWISFRIIETPTRLWLNTLFEAGRSRVRPLKTARSQPQ